MESRVCSCSWASSNSSIVPPYALLAPRYANGKRINVRKRQSTTRLLSFSPLWTPTHRAYLSRELLRANSNDHYLQHRHSSTLPRGELEGGLIPLVGDIFQFFRDRELLVRAFANLEKIKREVDGEGRKEGRCGAGATVWKAVLGYFLMTNPTETSWPRPV